MDKLTSFVQKTRYLWYAAITLALAIGFDFKTPKRQFTELRLETSELRTSVQALRAHNDSLRATELFYLYGLTYTSCQLLGRERWSDSPLPCRQLIDDKVFPVGGLVVPMRP